MKIILESTPGSEDSYFMRLYARELRRPTNRTAAEIEMKNVEGSKRIQEYLRLFNASLPTGTLIRYATIEARAAEIQREIHAMAESARRSTGQRFRYLRERTTAEFSTIKRKLQWHPSTK